MRRGIGLKRDFQPARSQRADLFAGRINRGSGVPFAVDSEESQAATLFETPKRSGAGRQPTINRDYAGKAIGIGERQPISDCGSLASAD